MGEAWQQYVVTDPNLGGMPVSSFEHPADWLPASHVQWIPQNPHQPVRMFARAVAPDGSSAVEFLPMQGFQWPPPPLMSAGQNNGGLVAQQPAPPVDAVAQLVVPQYRGQCQNLRVVSGDATPVAVPADPRFPNAQAQAHDVKLRLAYELDGAGQEEEFRARQTIISLPAMAWGMPPMTNWTLTDIGSCRARTGDLDAVLAIFERVLQSYQTNAQWTSAVQQTVRQLLQQTAQAGDQAIANGWRQVEVNAQASRAFMQGSADYVAAQGQRVAAMDSPVYTGTGPDVSSAYIAGDGGGSAYTTHNQTIDGIREEQTVFNPANTANEKFSSHSDYVWKDQDGNLQGTNDPSLDPNLGSTDNRQWTRAQVKRPGG